MDDIKVAFCIPVAEAFDPMFVNHAMSIVSYSSKNGVAVTNVGVVERTLIHQARNILATEFLRTDAEWAFWMDSDIVAPPDVLTRLLRVAKDKSTPFVTGVYYQRLGMHLPVLWVKDPISKDGEVLKLERKFEDDNLESYRHQHMVPRRGANDPLRADVCGFGCVITHRSMLEKLAYPYFKTLSGQCSEDFYFCVEAKKAGYKLWADPSIVLGHIGKPRVIFRKDFDDKNINVKEIKRMEEV